MAPVTKKKPLRWTAEEDGALKVAVKRHKGRCWRGIAEEVGSRDHVQCLQRWKKVLIPGLTKGQWTPEEDEQLIAAQRALPSRNWGVISKRVPGRTSKQCRERWCHHLDPSLKKNQPFTEGEDLTLLAAHKELGNRWVEIARQLPGRSEHIIKIRCKELTKSATASHGETRPHTTESPIASPQSKPGSPPPALSMALWSPSFGALEVDSTVASPPPLSQRPVVPAAEPHGQPQRNNPPAARELSAAYDEGLLEWEDLVSAVDPCPLCGRGGGVGGVGGAGAGATDVGALGATPIQTSAHATSTALSGITHGGTFETWKVAEYPAWLAPEPFDESPTKEPFGGSSDEVEDDKVDEFLEKINGLEEPGGTTMPPDGERITCKGSYLFRT